MDSEFVKLLSPALKTERGIEINICIFILLLQISDGASQAKGWPLLCMLLGEVSITHRTQGFQPPPNTTCLGPGGAERTQHPLPVRCCPCHRLPRSSARSRGNLQWERRAERAGSGSFNSCTHSHASRGAREPRKAPPSIRTAFPTEQPWPKAGRTQGSGRQTRALSRQDTARTPPGQPLPCCHDQRALSCPESCPGQGQQLPCIWGQLQKPSLCSGSRCFSKSAFTSPSKHPEGTCSS